MILVSVSEWRSLLILLVMILEIGSGKGVLLIIIGLAFMPSWKRTLKLYVEGEWPSKCLGDGAVIVNVSEIIDTSDSALLEDP